MVHIIGTLSGYIEWYKKQYIHAYMWLSNTSTCIDLYALIVVRLCDTFNFCFRLKKLLRNGKERDKRIKMDIDIKIHDCVHRHISRYDFNRLRYIEYRFLKHFEDTSR